MSWRRLEATFLPGDPPRLARFAFWHHTGTVTDATDELTLAVEGPRGVRRRRIPVRALPLADSLDLLLGPADDAAESLRAWSHAVRSGLALLARGRILPAVSPAGYGGWRVGPLDAEHTAWLRAFAAALPPAGHAVPVAGGGAPILPQPESLVTACWDALADTLARPDMLARPDTLRRPGALSRADDRARADTLTKARVPARDGDPTGPAPFAAVHPVPVGRYAGWVAGIDRELTDAARLVLRVETPDDPDGPFGLTPAVRGVTDPGLLLDVADLWAAPDAVRDRFGADADTAVLLALRRAARVWPVLDAVLAGRAPGPIPLADRDLDDLLGPTGARLAEAGAEVLWPAELLGRPPAVSAGTRSPAAVAGPAFALDELLDFRWQASLDGTELTDAEVRALAAAKRPLVRLRGRWVRVDEKLAARLRGRRRLTRATALAAALTGTLEVAGEEVEFRPDPALRELVGRLTAPAGDTAAPPEGLAATLRPYQRRGLAWLAGMCDAGLGGCLADDMGLGKTVQVIALHLHRRSAAAGPTLVVCPTSLLGNWERELERFAPGVAVHRFHGADRDLAGVGDDDVVLATYGVLRRDSQLAGRRWGLVVADEAQHVKNPLSHTARALRAVPAAARVALTGTPVENRLTDLWSVLDWTTPGLLGPLRTFRRRVAVPVERHGDADAAARLSTLVRPFLLRRRKSDPGIAPELPPKTETDRLVPLTAEQITLYEAVVQENLERIRAADGVARRGLVLSLLTALKQVCNHPAQYLSESRPRLAGRSGKLAAVDELLDVIVAEGESVLIFSQYVSMCRLLERHLAARGVASLLVHGGVPAARREARVRAFQAGEAPVFLLSLKAAGTGLNLTRAGHVVHYDRWWNPAVEDQATDRAYRIGQDRPVQVHRLVTEHTVEDRIAAMVADKRALADAVVGTGEAWLTELSDADLTELVELGRP